MITSVLKEMPPNWRIVPFGRILENGTRNGIYKPKEFHGSGAKIVNMGELFAYPRLFSIDMKRVRLTEREEEAFLLQPGDLLFARRSLVAEGAGRCSVVCEVSEPTTFESSIIRARPNKNLADSLFLFYLFKSSIGRYLIGTLLREMAVSGITGKDLVNLEIPLPPIEEQKAIAKILSSLDDKIELNRQMNATLEAMARALFKAWFVDFEPVRANMENRPSESASPEIAKLFPSEFENGIPRGWQIERMSDCIDVGIGKTPPRNEHQWFSKNPDDVRWVSIKDMGNAGVFSRSTSEYLTAEAVSKFNIRKVPDNTVLLSFKLTIGRVCITDGSCTTNEAIAHFVRRKDSPLNPYFLYLYLLNFNYQSLGSTSSIATAINSKTIKDMPALLPADGVLFEFERTVSPIFEKIKINQRETEKLAEIRDSLLPRLISGKIPIGKIENEVQGENE